MRRSTLFFLLLSLTAPARAALSDATPAEVGLDPERLAHIDQAVKGALDAGQAPGAVVLVARHGKVAFRKAYGKRCLRPAPEDMTADTIFDLASLTKPVATASSVLLLVERGRLSLSDKVADHLPGFGKNGKDAVTVEQLLLHTSGLVGDNPVSDYAGGVRKALEAIDELPLTAPPGKKFTYSDVGYIVLGELVEKVSGQGLDSFARKNLFEPLGLRDTSFRPKKEMLARVAPTQLVKGEMLRGVVHDPRARLLGGVAGDAGLFGTADDLAVFAQMLLDEGKHGEKQILAASTVKVMSAPREVPGGRRALGWDVRTAYSGNRGELFEGFGHTGFTGTSIWVDPPSRTMVIVLTNRVHPDGKGDVWRLRSRIATLAAEAVVRPPFPGKGGRK